MRDEKVMKSIKIIIALLMIFVCIPVSNISALESTDNSNIIIYTPTEEEFRAAEEIEIAKMKAYFERTKESYAYDYRKLVTLKHLHFHHIKMLMINQQEVLFLIRKIAVSIGVIVQEVQEHGL